MFKIRCQYCGKIFNFRHSKKKFCSRLCFIKSKRGKIAVMMTEAVKNKMSKTRIGHEVTRKTRMKISKANKGKRLGSHHSSETIATMRDGRRKGVNCPNWKGGRRKHNLGYVQLKNETHPFRDKNGYVLEHRLVVEKHIGKHLQPYEPVHHINKIHNDNRPQNLIAFRNNGVHLKFERKVSIDASDIIFDGRKL